MLLRRLLIALLGFAFYSSPLIARDFLSEPKIHWSKDGKFDFCPDTKAFDYRNAYWLAAMSYYSYWQPSYLEQIFTAPLGLPVKLEIPEENGRPGGTIESFGLGWKGHVDFFTSEALHPHSPTKYNDHHISYFTAPLPYEACVKKEKQWCFGSNYQSRKGAMEINECGANLEYALMTKERLHNINELVRGVPLEPATHSQALSDKRVIENYVKSYEENKKIDLGLNFADSHFEERCEIYRVDKDFTPDVQAIWVESPELVVVAFRGTENDNLIDWTTDLATSFQLNHMLLPFWKRNVHKGYEQSLEVMSDWLQSEVNHLFNAYPKAAQIPIYVTGHSMGGAIAALVMTQWLERNQKISKDLRLNLKAIYTFGAPRVGNKDFAKSFEKLNTNENVGVYRLVNNKDVVTRAPCLDYSHFGANIQLLTSGSSATPSNNISVLVNPDNDKYNYCAWGTSLPENVINFQQYARDHYMESYYGALASTRNELNRVLRLEEINYNQRHGRLEIGNNPYRFPANCQKVPFTQTKIPDFIKYNYQDLEFEIEP